MISTRSVGLLIDTFVCLTLAKWETVSGRFGGYLRTIELIVHESANCRTPRRHGCSVTVQALCVVDQLMLEFPVRLVQELPVVFSCAEYSRFQDRSSNLLASPITSAIRSLPPNRSRPQSQ